MRLGQEFTRLTKLALMLLSIVLPNCGQASPGVQKDFVIEGLGEAALDLPRILFLLKRQPRGPALKVGGRFEVNYAFLDTGASGIVLSRETAEQMGLAIEPKARFADVGIGGVEYFNISEPLYMGLAGFNVQNPGDAAVYDLAGPGRFQVKKSKAGLLAEPLDVVGMPAMAGRVVVLDSGATNRLEYFAADIKTPGDPSIPKVDLEVVLRLHEFSHPKNPKNIAPLPVLAANPVIDNIIIRHKNVSSQGSWLLDTGATISLISVKQGARLGLTDKHGKPVVTPAFSLPIGGIGKMVQVPGFEIGELIVPTRSGRNIVFKNARLGVHDISYFDEKKGRVITLDGVFGSNFLCASAKMAGLFPTDISETPFDKIVIDIRRGVLGFRIGKRLKR